MAVLHHKCTKPHSKFRKNLPTLAGAIICWRRKFSVFSGGLWRRHPLKSLNIQDLGAAAVREKLAGGSARTVLVPVGSCERHGNPFTPLGLDGIVTSGVVQRAARKADVLYTPLMPFGYAPHHVGRMNEGHGTVTLRAETYRRVLEDIGRSLIYQGFDRLVFVSFHSFNVDCAQEVLFSLRHKTGALAAFFGGRESNAAAQILELAARPARQRR